MLSVVDGSSDPQLCKVNDGHFQALLDSPWLAALLFAALVIATRPTPQTAAKSEDGSLS